MANNIYINIGTEDCCFFVRMSTFLIRQLEKYPFLYYAVEEALQCAQNGHYAAGIITFSQLLNLLNRKTPKYRHLVAHEILQIRPTRDAYEQAKQDFEKASEDINKKEISKHKNATEYAKEVFDMWQKLIEKLN